MQEPDFTLSPLKLHIKITDTKPRIMLESDHDLLAC